MPGIILGIKFQKDGATTAQRISGQEKSSVLAKRDTTFKVIYKERQRLCRRLMLPVERSRDGGKGINIFGMQNKKSFAFPNVTRSLSRTIRRISGNSGYRFSGTINRGVNMKRVSVYIDEQTNG